MSHVTTAARPQVATTAAIEGEAAPRTLPSVAPPLAGGRRIVPIIPQSLAEVRQLAETISRSGAAPKSYRSDNGAGPVNIDMVSAAILVGLEVGLAPMAALTGIVMLDDGPVIWGDARDGLVAASGLLVDMKEEMTVDDSGLFLSATCTVWRKDRQTPITQTVTRSQAELAGWLQNEVWQTNPNRMAQMRAKGWANRDAFPDVLKGLKVYDEENDFIDVTSRGAATTAPARPRRADFQAGDRLRDAAPAADAGQSEPPRPLQDREDPAGAEDDGWPLYDEIGETIGSYPPTVWHAEFEKLTDKLEGGALANAFENNRDAGIKIATDHAEEIGEIIAEGLRAIFDIGEAPEPARNSPDRSAADPKDLCPEGKTQEDSADLIVALLKGSATVKAVNRILKANATRMKAWRRSNQIRVNAAADTRLEDLQLGGPAR